MLYVDLGRWNLYPQTCNNLTAESNTLTLLSNSQHNLYYTYNIKLSYHKFTTTFTFY